MTADSNTGDWRIREAAAGDVDVLAAFTLEEAKDAESVALDAAVVRQGILSALRREAPIRYWLALRTGRGEAAGSIAVIREWSDWRAAYYWWVQFLYVVPEARGGGLAGELIEHVRGVARIEGALELRLYVHGANARALRAYEKQGWRPLPYLAMHLPVRE